MQLFKKRHSTNKPHSKRTPLETVEIIATTLVGCILAITLIVGSIGSVYLISVISDAPKINLDDLKPKPSSIIYASNGEVIGEVGKELRVNVVYEQLPQVVVDAFLAIEDSRFFVHNGFDIPRFVKAIIVNLQNGDFSQGGSTFTMQMIKNAYFVEEGSGGAEKTIQRKLQEIYLAIMLEPKTTKKVIFQNYINKINFGGPARGIQKAAQYYFGKNVEQLTLGEAALLAGVINLPNIYNPYYDPIAGKERRDVVLDMMLHHGYITETDVKLAKAIKIEDMLVGETNYGEIIPYQAYLDTVVDEVIKTTGFDPYEVPMRIYTAMDIHTQQTMENILAGKYKSVPLSINGYLNSASIAVNNKTGEIVGIGGGRNYAGQRVFNFATQMKKQPGSTSKPILDYVLAFEYCGYHTGMFIDDVAINYPGSRVQVNDYDGKYKGLISLETAIADSRNVPAIITLKRVMNAIGNEKIVNYMNSIGFEFDVKNFNVQYGIGGSGFETSPMQLAGAYSILVNDGIYMKPHTVRRIEFFDEMISPIETKINPVKAVSPQAAYLTSVMLKANVDKNWGNWMYILKRKYPIYAKTGTSDWGTEAERQYGFPRSASKDKWMVASSRDYTITTWVGFDKAIKGKKTYYSPSISAKNLPGNINKILLDAVHLDKKTPGAVPRPSGIVTVGSAKGFYPFVSASGGNGSSGLAKANSAFFGPAPAAIIGNPTNLYVTSTIFDTYDLKFDLYKLPMTFPYASPEGITYLSNMPNDPARYYGQVIQHTYMKVDGTVIATVEQPILTNVATTPVKPIPAQQIILPVGTTGAMEACTYYTYTDLPTLESLHFCVVVTPNPGVIDPPPPPPVPLSWNTFKKWLS